MTGRSDTAGLSFAGGQGAASKRIVPFRGRSRIVKIGYASGSGGVTHFRKVGQKRHPSDVLCALPKMM